MGLFCFLTISVSRKGYEQMGILYGTTLVGKKFEYSCESDMLKKANELEQTGYAVKRAAKRDRFGFPLFIVAGSGL